MRLSNLFLPTARILLAVLIGCGQVCTCEAQDLQSVVKQANTLLDNAPNERMPVFLDSLRTAAAGNKQKLILHDLLRVMWLRSSGNVLAAYNASDSIQLDRLGDPHYLHYLHQYTKAEVLRDRDFLDEAR
ncbi:MAG: hypothetical protein ABIY71_06160, partial [Flavobacteriales bacterium]